MTGLSVVEALSGVFGSISLVSWVFVLVNVTSDDPHLTATKKD